jgi:hypothetical protein
MRWKCVTAEPLRGGWRLAPQFLWLALLVPGWLGAPGGAAAQDDARMRQLRLLCAQLSGDLTDPGGIAAFQRCLTTHDPLGEIRRDNNIGGGTPAADRPGAKPPPHFGHNSRRTLADGVQRFATRDGRLFYVIDRDGKLWRGKPATKEAHTIDQNVAAIELIDDANILTLGTDGRLWRREGDAAGRALVDEKVASFQARVLSFMSAAATASCGARSAMQAAETWSTNRSHPSRRSTPIGSMSWAMTASCGAKTGTRETAKQSLARSLPSSTWLTAIPPTC